MAKIPFSKLGIKSNVDVATFKWGEYDIEVRQYLPMEEKAELITKVINLAADDNGYYNPLRVKVFLTLETTFAYTNLTFTAKMKEDLLKLYDLLIGSGLFDLIVQNIPEDEWKYLDDSIWSTIANVYEYQNSALGILTAITNDYNSTSFDLDAINAKIKDPETLAIVKEIIPMINAGALGQNN
jgi:hypothetical protein